MGNLGGPTGTPNSPRIALNAGIGPPTPLPINRKKICGDKRAATLIHPGQGISTLMWDACTKNNNSFFIQIATIYNFSFGLTFFRV